jgi:hypothetical protein
MKVKTTTAIFFMMVLNSCAVMEQIVFQENGSGTIEITAKRDEKSYFKINPNGYNAEDDFLEESWTFEEVIKSNSENFSRLTIADKAVYNKFIGAQYYSKKNSAEKDYKNITSMNFVTAQDIPDLYKITDYEDNIKKNYALSAEKHDASVNYFFDGNHFSRKAFVTNNDFHNERLIDIEKWKTYLKGIEVVKSYTLSYSFARKIKSVSNPKAVIGNENKTVTVTFDIFEALKNPEITNLDVFLED